MAVSHALTILRWQENLLPDELPPEWMWHLPDELEEWFEVIEARRKDGSDRDDLDDAPDMVQNELARGRR